MLEGPQLAGVLIQVAAAAAAVYGAVRCVRLQRFAGDRRLKALAWFFALFALAMVLQAAWQASAASGPPPGFGDGQRPPFNGTRPPFDRGVFRPEGEERVNILFAGAHAAMLASLVVAVWAFGHRRPPVEAAPALAAAPFVLVGGLVPLMLALETGLTLYLACRALINHVERRSVGAVQVALGFLLFFVGHFLVFLAHQPGASRSGVGDILGLVGIVLLVQALPRAT